LTSHDVALEWKKKTREEGKGERRREKGKREKDRDRRRKRKENEEEEERNERERERERKSHKKRKTDGERREQRTSCPSVLTTNVEILGKWPASRYGCSLICLRTEKRDTPKISQWVLYVW
jgi:hypothetical protein